MARRHIHSVEDARVLARRRVPRMMFDFVDGAAGDETGVAHNRSAFRDIKLQPRVLVNVETCDLTTSLFGTAYGLPFGFAPMGMCNLTWPGADAMLAREAVNRNLPTCVSTASSTTLEEMRTLSQGRAWFQLYAGESREATFAFVDRAAAAGYGVLVLTVDVPQVSRRIRDLKNGFQVPFRLGAKQVLDFACHPHWSIATLLAGIPKPMNYETSDEGSSFVRGESRRGTDYNFLAALRERWSGKLVVKGVTAPDDAQAIRAAGADAIYVSNHGARQLDSAPPALKVLPAIRDAVGPDYPLIFDSGVRCGEDVVKAIALGADFVMLGRPLMYAIGADSARGLGGLLDILAHDINVVMAQLGVTRTDDIGAEVLYEPA
ncbi:MAG: alpha-hydroxy acid oxidase [Hyphomicrobiaceae bacterium]